MAASLTALAAVVRADVAQASITPSVELSDELPQFDPVKMTKVEHPPEPEELPEFVMPTKKHGKRIDFGTFEGY